jgi:branched-chain amino acid transport system permease protein
MQLNWKRIAQYGLITGIAIIFLSLVGVVEAFNARDVIFEVLLLGRALMMVVALGMGYVVAMKLGQQKPALALTSGLISGLIGGLVASLLVVVMVTWEGMRDMFVNASPGLLEILTFSQENLVVGTAMLIGSTALLSLLGAAIQLLPGTPRQMIIAGLGAILLIGMLQELLDVIMNRFDLTKTLADFLFGRKGLSVAGAITVFVVFSLLNGLWATQNQMAKDKVNQMPVKQRAAFNWALIILGVTFMVFLPQVVGPYISQILVLVGLYALMGLGLNIEIGLAGLLDLGFVGFFAIGAYTVALMTSTAELGLSNVVAGDPGTSYTSFWVAIPVAVFVSALAGIFLGIPVLRMRGDYLAIVTLGFAEIIRILVLSNFLQPLLGGAQGILNIPKPDLGYLGALAMSMPETLRRVVFFFSSDEGIIKDPQHFYYLIILGCLFIAFIAWRLQNARIGRNWMALREDEDVAEAMGINLIASKLLAFGIGAAFAGLSGAIFAAQVGSVFPHSFGLIVSINVVSLVIIGGSGSIPGVVVGALVLVGLPELLREFSEFRMLIYGALLVVMMLVKPEGFWPSEVRRRELRDDIEPVTISDDPVVAAG